MGEEAGSTRRKKILVAAALLVLLLLGFTFPFQNPISLTDTGDLTVNVENNDGDLVQNAEVEFPLGDQGYTDSSGQTTFENKEFGQHEITVTNGGMENTTQVNFSRSGEVTIILNSEKNITGGGDPSKVSESVNRKV